MNKSIYDEALEELTWLLHDEFDETPKRSRLNVSQRLNMFKKVKDALEQAQKQEKMLELYKGYYEINETNNIVEFLKRTGEFELVKTKIKELENE